MVNLFRDDAINLLIACVPLSAKLFDKGVNVELYEEDRAALRGFNQVWASNWLGESDVFLLAGLSNEDITMLQVKSLQELLKRIQVHLEQTHY